MAATTVVSVACVVVLSLYVIRRYRVHVWGKCRSKRSMKGKTVIITGASSGIGKACAEELASRGARVILACRDMQKVAEAIRDIRRSTSKGELIAEYLDLASLTSVRNFAKNIEATQDRVDALVNNAGVFQCPFTRTEDGFEMQMGVNHLGHFLLTVLMMNALKHSTPSRIVVVTSALYKKGRMDFEEMNSEKRYDKRAAYNNSKLANVLFSRELHGRLMGSGVNVYVVSPGHVWTKLGRHLKVPWWKMILLAPLALLFVRTPSQGCQTVVNCVVSEELEHESGKYYRNCKEESFEEVACNEGIAEKLWDVSEKLTGVKASF